MKSRLIIIEGIPGSGKSSTAQYVAEYLQSRGIQSELFSEGNLDHPADCESMAYFTPQQFEEFVRANVTFESIIRAEATVHEQHVLLSYGKLRANPDIPIELINHISKFEVYELPSEKYCEILLKRWNEFAEYQQNKNGVVIFECCLLQNTICKLLVQHNEEHGYILNYLNDLCRSIEKLDPILVYLNPLNISETINKVRIERSSAWLDFAVWYHTQQEYGRTLGFVGIDGYVEVLELRRSLELEILWHLPIHVIRIDDPQKDWIESHHKIQESIQA
jgi:hypothetical protein